MPVVKNYYKNADLHSSAKYTRDKEYKYKNKYNLHCFGYLFTGTFLLCVFTSGYKRILTDWGCGGTQKKKFKQKWKKIGVKKRRQCCPSTINQWTTSQIFSPSSSERLTLHLQCCCSIRLQFHLCLHERYVSQMHQPVVVLFFTTVMGRRGLGAGGLESART